MVCLPLSLIKLFLSVSVSKPQNNAKMLYGVMGAIALTVFASLLIFVNRKRKCKLGSSHLNGEFDVNHNVRFVGDEDGTSICEGKQQTINLVSIYKLCILAT